MHIVNVWGMFFCFALPLIISIYLVYLEGIEEGKERIIKNKRNVRRVK